MLTDPNDLDNKNVGWYVSEWLDEDDDFRRRQRRRCMPLRQRALRHTIKRHHHPEGFK